MSASRLAPGTPWLDQVVKLGGARGALTRQGRAQEVCIGSTKRSLVEMLPESTAQPVRQLLVYDSTAKHIKGHAQGAGGGCDRAFLGQGQLAPDSTPRGRAASDWQESVEQVISAKTQSRSSSNP